jgi:hypothetical protein
MGTELRSAVRVDVNYPVRFSGDSMIGQGTIINLSTPGCAIRTSMAMQPGDYLELRIMTPDQARPLTVSLAKVRWTMEETAGVEFIRVRRENQGRIQRLIDRLLHEPAADAYIDSPELAVA